MAFSSDNNPNNSFGIPGINIKPTLSDLFDPYSGIDLTEQVSCDHVEIMTLPDSSISPDELTFCEDAFASNGPTKYGGNGQPGRCVNSGTINCRYLGRHANNNHINNVFHVAEWAGYQNYLPTLSVTNEETGGGTYNTHGKWTDWNGQILNEDTWNGLPEGHGAHVKEQIGLFDRYFPSNSSYGANAIGGNPFPNYTDYDKNIGEWRSYITTNETGTHNFCLYVDDYVGIWMDDGDQIGSDLEYVSGRYSYGYH